MFGRIREAMGEAVARFDAALIDAHDATALLDDVVAIENMAGTVKAMAAARIAETSLWRSKGDRTEAHAFARQTGVSVGQARETIETGRRLRDLPATSAAARRGELSVPQAAAITDAASVDPDAEARLLVRAGSASLGELRDDCARAKANVTDLEARRRRIHAARHVRNWVDRDGAGHLHLMDNPERIAAISCRINQVRDELHASARDADPREPLEAYAADALHRIVCGASEADVAAVPTTPGVKSETKPGTRPGTKLLVRVDLGALLRGHPVDDEVCEIAGYGPVAVSAVRELLDTSDPFLAAIVTHGEAVVGVGHLGRRANARQQSALEWLYPTCAVEGCNANTFLENDHRADWARTGITVLDLLDRLCSHHHRLKTTRGWALVDGEGKRALVAPDDHRHPRHQRSHADAHGPPVAA